MNYRLTLQYPNLVDFIFCFRISPILALNHQRSSFGGLGVNDDDGEKVFEHKPGMTVAKCLREMSVVESGRTLASCVH